MVTVGRSRMISRNCRPNSIQPAVCCVSRYDWSPAKKSRSGFSSLSASTISGRAPRRPGAVARHVGDDDGPAGCQFAADFAGELRLGPVANAVRHVLRVVPLLDAEVRVPAGVLDRRPGRLDPLAVALKLQPGDHLLPRLQRVELRRHLQDAAVAGVEREDDNLIPRHVERRRLVRPLELGRPPVARSQVVELRVGRPERLCRDDLGHDGRRFGGPRDAPEGGRPQRRGHGKADIAAGGVVVVRRHGGTQGEIRGPSL